MTAKEELRWKLIKGLRKVKQLYGLRRKKRLEYCRILVRTAIKDNIPITDVIDLIDEIDKLSKETK